LCDLVQHSSLVGIRLAQNRMQGCHQWHLQLAEQEKNMAPRSAAKDAIFMLQADEVIAVEVEKFCCPLVGTHIFLRNLQPYLFWIFIARVRIVDRDREESLSPIFRGNR